MRIFTDFLSTALIVIGMIAAFIIFFGLYVAMGLVAVGVALGVLLGCWTIAAVLSMLVSIDKHLQAIAGQDRR